MSTISTTNQVVDQPQYDANYVFIFNRKVEGSGGVPGYGGNLVSDDVYIPMTPYEKYKKSFAMMCERIKQSEPTYENNKKGSKKG